MPTDAEREALARLIDPAAYLDWDDNPTAREDRAAWQSKALYVAERILDAGYHKDSRIPEPGTPEWEAAVERMLVGWYGEKSWAQIQKFGPDTHLAHIREDAQRAIAALREAGNDR